MLLSDATFEKFGYHLASLVPTSHKRVICFCPQCGQSYETQRRYYWDGRLCKLCTDRQQAVQNCDRIAFYTARDKHNQQSREMGVSPNGLPLVVGDRDVYTKQYKQQYRAADEERTKQQNRDAQQKRRQTLIGKVSNRLRVALRKYLQGKGGFSQLPYTPAELQAHIQAKLDERQYLCPMCGVSLEEKFDIDHRIPLSSAKTVDEVVALFALSNLDVLCPPCNQHKKKTKHIEY